jgi:hypothetical protein
LDNPKISWISFVDTTAGMSKRLSVAALGGVRPYIIDDLNCFVPVPKRIDQAALIILIWEAMYGISDGRVSGGDPNSQHWSIESRVTRRMLIWIG